jgi:hypothetical protein
MRATLLVCALLLACNGSTIINQGPSGSCPLPSGTFTEHFVTVDAGAQCPPQPDQTVVLDGTESFLTPDPDAGIAGGVTHCTTEVGASTCTYSANCVTDVDGGTALVVQTSVTFSGDTAHGTQLIEPNSCSPDVCQYQVTIAKAP